MRFEIINTITNESDTLTLPRGLNPVRLGANEKNNVVLASAYVGQETGAIYNDGKHGWQFWNLNGRKIVVQGTVLADKGTRCPIGDGASIVCSHFHLRVFFDPEEFMTEADDMARLDRACSDLVRELHGELLQVFTTDVFDRKKDLEDSAILKVEQKIEELACTRKEFPVDDLTQTALGNHLAGLAVRSRLLHDLIERSGITTQTFKESRQRESWTRLRTALPEYEQELSRLVAEARREMDLTANPDLTEQMKVVEAKFWDFWKALLAGRSTPPARLRRYLGLRRLREEIKFIWYGFGPLEDLLDDPTITEIMVVNQDRIFIEKGGKPEKSGRQFLTSPVEIIRKIVNRSGREFNVSNPLADARLPDGSRVNAVSGDIALSGACLTIRRFPRKRRTIRDLLRRDPQVPAACSLTVAAARFLRAAVINRRNILVAGGTGSGKTTLLNILSRFIPDKERIVTIEDTAELQLQKEHVITLQARQKNAEGTGEVTIRDLVRNALRMRPDRIVVGECRGGEALDMLQAMNTGHDGSLTTIHANSPEDVVLRLEVLVQQAGSSRLPVESIHRQIVSAIDLIVQLRQMPFGDRKFRVVTEISEVVDVEEDGGVRIVPLFHREEGGELRATGHLATFLPDLIDSGLVRDPVGLVRQGGTSRRARQAAGS
jgi:Flp pilus assembly CpaF family ATPase